MSKITSTLVQRGNRYGEFEDNAKLINDLLDITYKSAKSDISQDCTYVYGRSNVC